MYNYKLTIQYDGTKYNGWQKQGNTENTIQGKIEKVLSVMLQEDIEIHGAGRTDAGVHAKGQIANFKLKRKLEAKDILDYLNHYLPMDIAIINVEEVEERFHSRLNAKAKRYQYVINNSNISEVFLRKYVYQYEEALDVKNMRKASTYLIGRHDFRSFCTNKHMKKSTIREIYDIKITKEGTLIYIDFYGEGFLHNMIRIMVGTLIEVGTGRIEKEKITEILETLDRKNAGYTSPPNGLTLISVEY